jgi:hypothetical protein
LVATKAQHAFASDHFKMAFLAWGSDKAAIDSHCQRTVRWREPIPVALTAVNKAALFLTQFPLQALRYIRNVLANGEGTDGLVDRQHLLQEFRGHPIAH